jgi:hypothetical protein
MSNPFEQDALDRMLAAPYNPAMTQSNTRRSPTQVAGTAGTGSASPALDNSFDSEMNDRIIAPQVCQLPTLPNSGARTWPPELYGALEVLATRVESTSRRAVDDALKAIESYLVAQGSCVVRNPDVSNEANYRLFSLDTAELEKALRGPETFNSAIHANLACAIDSLFVNLPPDSPYKPLVSERIRNWFPKLRRIGEPSIEGYAFLTSFEGKSEIFVMKVPVNPANDYLLHEATIGMYVSSTMRRLVPNFMYVYGYSTCSPPGLDNGKVVTWCSSQNTKVSYLITENIFDATTFADFVTKPGINYQDVIKVLMQVINALNLASKKMKYTHYDLHGGNVLVRNFKTPVAVPYYGTGSTILGYIMTQYVPYIIDYGYSRADISGISIFKNLFVRGMEKGESFPMYDIFKLLGFLSESVRRKPITDPHIKVVLDNMFPFFRQGTYEQFMAQPLLPGQPRTYYQAPEFLRGETYDNLINWISPALGQFYGTTAEVEAAGVTIYSTYNPFDNCTFYDQLNSGAGPETSLEYCDAAFAAERSGNPEGVLRWLNENFDAEQTYVNTLAAVKSKLRKVQSMLQGVTLIPAFPAQPGPEPNTQVVQDSFCRDTLVHKTFTNEYHRHVLYLMMSRDYLTDITSFFRSSVCALTKQNKMQVYRRYIVEIEAETQRLVNIVKANVDVMVNNLGLLMDTKLENYTNNPIVLRWWTLDLPAIWISLR